MPLLNLTVQHGRTLEEAQRGLETAVHAMGDIPILGGLLGAQLGEGLKQIGQQTFQNKLP
jgi:hypothetical protein